MKTEKVWDLFVRVFHWSLVAGVISQLATAEDHKSLHAAVGYYIGALLVLRIIWGFVGTRHARFSDFICAPAEIFAYLKSLYRGRPRHYVGHNPAGGAMVCLLLFILALSALTGLLTYGAQGRRPLALLPVVNLVHRAAADDDRLGDRERREYRDHTESSRQDRRESGGAAQRVHFWKEIHESIVGVLIFLVSVHVGGVIVASYLHKENLILAMLTGYKKGDVPGS